MVKSWNNEHMSNDLLDTPVIRCHFQNIKERVSCVKISPGGKSLAIATEMGKVLNMNLKSFKIDTRSPFHKAAVYSLVWVSENEFLSVCFKGGVSRHAVSNNSPGTHANGPDFNMELSEYSVVIQVR